MAGNTEGTRKMNLGEAAEALDITREAVRRRAKRGTLPSETGEDGRLYVWVDADHHAKAGQGGGHEDGHDHGEHDRDELVEELKDRIRYLEEESRRKDHLLAAALERIPPALKPPHNAPESPESAGEAQGSTMTPTAQDEPESATQRPWWRRLIGG